MRTIFAASIAIAVAGCAQFPQSVTQFNAECDGETMTVRNRWSDGGRNPST
jgi:hypothetical protein